MFNMREVSAETLKAAADVLKGAPSNAFQDIINQFMGAGNVRKDYPSGLVAYDLEPVARVLQPVITPIRNRMPRVKGKGGTAANWKQITSLDVNKNNTFQPFGTKAPVVSYSSVDRAATYRTFAMGDNVSIQAMAQAIGLEDAKSGMTVRLLANVMILEEQGVISGRNSALGAVGTVTTTGTTGGGSIAANTYYVVCRICTPIAKATAANIAGTGSIVSRGRKSAQASVVVGANGIIAASVPVLDGGVVYEWYVGTVNDSTSEKLEAVTSINSVLLTSLAGTGLTVPADNSADSNAFDGILAQGSGTGTFGNFGYSKMLANGVAGTGTTFALSDIDFMLMSLFRDYGADPEFLVMAPQQAMDLTAKCRAAGLIRFVVDDHGPIGQLVGGQRVTHYINPSTGRIIECVVDPWWPVGSIFAMSMSVPVPLGEITNAWEVKTQLDYLQLEYAQTAPKYEIEILSLEAVAGYFLIGCGLLGNIANG